MIKLYHCVTACSFRPLWTLEELGLSYELAMLPFPPRVLRKDFLQINSLGTVPAFFDHELRMTESSAICHYLVSRYGPTPLNVAPEENGYGAFLNWLHFGEATLTFPQTIVLRYGRFEPAERRLPLAVEDYTRWFLSRLRLVESTVSTASYLCADRF
jgi:glutathione S-transferase